MRVLAAEGVRAVTHRAVATEAGASVGLITYHFSTTQALIAATLDALAAEEAKQMAELRDRIIAVPGDVEALTEILVAEVAARAGERRDRALAGHVLTLEIPRMSIDRLGFDEWESAAEDAYAALLTALGRQPERSLVDFLEAALDGLFLYAMISREPETVTVAARAGLRLLLGSLSHSDATTPAK